MQHYNFCPGLQLLPFWPSSFQRGNTQTLSASLRTLEYFPFIQCLCHQSFNIERYYKSLVTWISQQLSCHMGWDLCIDSLWSLPQFVSSEWHFLSCGAGPYVIENVIIAFFNLVLEFLTPWCIWTSTQPHLQLSLRWPQGLLGQLNTGFETRFLYLHFCS